MDIRGKFQRQKEVVAAAVRESWYARNDDHGVRAREGQGGHEGGAGGVWGGGGARGGGGTRVALVVTGAWGARGVDEGRGGYSRNDGGVVNSVLHTLNT